MQYAVAAVGTFSIFEAASQRDLRKDDGFSAVRFLLTEKGEGDLLELFDLFKHAINVLKHGSGRSYDALLEYRGVLPFRMKLPDQYFFDEGDVTEIDTLVLAGHQFLIKCAQIVDRVYKVVL